jgi:hypothetical protein
LCHHRDQWIRAQQRAPRDRALSVPLKLVFSFFVPTREHQLHILIIEKLDKMSKSFPIRDGSVSEEIAQALSKFLTTSTYACGGTVKISQLHADDTETPATAEAVKTSAEPVTIRWDSATSIEKLTFPLSSEEEHKAVEKLVAGTQPASFGYQGRDVIDESYRKASKLDTSAFSTNFCPYEVGIIDVIGQALLPKVPSSSQGIRAELYKLNVRCSCFIHTCPY